MCSEFYTPAFQVPVQVPIVVAECRCQDTLHEECSSSPVENCRMVDELVEIMVVREECTEEVKFACEDRDVPVTSLIEDSVCRDVGSVVCREVKNML